MAISKNLFLSQVILGIFVLLGDNAIARTSSEPQNSTLRKCASDEIEVFSCSTAAGQFFEICLSKANFAPQFVTVNGDDHFVSVPGFDLRQYISTPSAHGANIVVKAKIKDGDITLFLDTNQYDLYSPAISVLSNGHVDTKFCNSQGARLNRELLVLNGKEELVDIFTLTQIGAANALSSVPNWPEEN